MHQVHLRTPAVSGRFYPRDEGEQRAELEAMIGERPKPRAALGVVTPHAGWQYSGAVAGRTLGSVIVPEQVVVMCPNHTGRGAPLAVSAASAYGCGSYAVPVEHRLAQQLASAEGFELDDVAHAREHAIEVLLPILRFFQPEVRVVPVCTSTLPLQLCERVGEILARTVEAERAAGRAVLICASSDMSHYLPAAEAAGLDERALSAILAVDPARLYRTVHDHRITMCGLVPVTVLLFAARFLGQTRAELIEYRHSGMVTGDHSSVVGYAGLVIG